MWACAGITARPITELYGRLVNLDVAPDSRQLRRSSASTPPVRSRGRIIPVPWSIRINRHISPQIAMSWRPFSASSMVVRAGYGVYYNTSVYNSIANQMAQQSPLSTSLRVRTLPTIRSRWRTDLSAIASTTATTFAVDPNFRAGILQNWQTSVQRDLPVALQMVATYLGSKGTHAQQEFLPNTYPMGAVIPARRAPRDLRI